MCSSVVGHWGQAAAIIIVFSDNVKGNAAWTAKSGA